MTSYTARITLDTTLAEWAMLCARDFLVQVRALSLDDKIPERFESSDSYAKRAAEARQELEKWRRATPEQAEMLRRIRIEKERADAESRSAENGARRARYERMRAIVRGWKPPTKGHAGLREFMLEQIEGSLEMDCGDGYDYIADAADRLARLSPDDFRASQIASFEKDAAYYETEYAEEVKRTEAANKWLRELRESLKEG